MRFDWKRWNIGGKVIFCTTCLATVSMFMPWMDMGIVTRNGISQGAFLYLIFWLYPIIKLLKNENIKYVWGLACPILSIIAVTLHGLNATVELFGETSNFSGSGCGLFLIASFGLIIGVLTYKPALAK